MQQISDTVHFGRVHFQEKRLNSDQTPKNFVCTADCRGIHFIGSPNRLDFWSMQILKKKRYILAECTSKKQN